MQLSALGYLRPQVNNIIAKDTEQQISRVCPGVVVAHETIGANYHPNWGPIESLNVGYAEDTDVRRLGSSGGVISAVCIYLLQSKQVDFIAQIAADAANPIANKLQISRSREDVINAAGSRYAPSAPLATLNELLARNERFAFVGKPCDAAALRAYLRDNPQYKKQVPFILSFMCAGIPSQNATVDVINAMGANPAQVTSFRYRGDGWPGMARAVQADGQSFEMDYNSSWGNILGRQLQYRCKICADGTGEFADLVCADAWYGKNGYPDFAERDGRSLIIARSQTGKNLLSSAIQSNTIKCEHINPEEISAMQPYQVNRRQLAAARGIATYFAQGRTTKFKGFGLLKQIFSGGIIYTLRNAWGTYKRASGEF
ncbi:MAG TPA: Coenzyme F420 hydrogenase/dehydrogenase, beta subunit C-terminal domain [Cellvibrionaceae bacterium]|nr:Coenzyme F420 hydrogenase/dehydrogenase, beta subunit C-terminal domain [Cellvibrionaceae bacterium]